MARQAFNAVPLRSFDLLWHDRATNDPIEIEVVLQNGGKLCMELIPDSTEQVYVRPRRDTARELVQNDLLPVTYVSSVDGLETEEPAHNPDWIATLMGRQRPGSILRNLLLDVSRGHSWDRLRESVQRLFGLDILVPQTLGGAIISEFQKPGEGFALDIMSAGSGFHQVLLLLSTLYSRPGAVLLIDEPDAHLHVFLQDTIFSELRSVAAETKSQIIIATHSEVIFRSVPADRLLVMMGTPRRISDNAEREQLAKAMGVLEQVDIVQALQAPGVMYLEGYTDLNLLRAWATRLAHGSLAFLDRAPFWKPLVWEARDMAGGIKAEDHFRALKLVRSNLTGIRLIDMDGKGRSGPADSAPRAGELNRMLWSLYESESYLAHPVALARFISANSESNGEAVVREFFENAFGHELYERFREKPFDPPPLVKTYLTTTKARTEIVGGVLTLAGIHGFSYTDFDRLAAIMEPSEIHPEVVEKLDFIQTAFGL
ncbi:MAG: AAA family ATPase [Verrucomicrobiota bacterium]